MKYIFLDFDGVLHEANPVEPFCHSKKLCESLLPYKEKFKVIISSSFREQCSFVVLKQALKYGLSNNVVGVTPVLKKPQQYIRHFEILEYCKTYGIEEQYWIAVDDNSSFFKPEITNLILTDSKTGLSEKNIQDIVNFVNS